MPTLDECKTLLHHLAGLLKSEGGIKHAIAHEALVLGVKKVLDEATAQEALGILGAYKNDAQQDIRCVLCQLSVLCAISSCKDISKKVIDGSLVIASDAIIVGTTGGIEVLLEAVEAIADILIAVSGVADFGLSELILPEAIVAEEAADLAVGAAVAGAENKLLKIVRLVISNAAHDVENGAENYLLAKNICQKICAHLSCCSADSSAPFSTQQLLESTQAMINCTPNKSVSDIHKMFWLKGGWEGWAQVTLAIIYEQLPKVIHCQREQHIYDEKQKAVDFLLTHGQLNSQIELKCESIFQSAQGASKGENRFGQLVAMDMEKMSSLEAYNYVVAIACSEEAILSMQELCKTGTWEVNIASDGEYRVGFYVCKVKRQQTKPKKRGRESLPRYAKKPRNEP